MNMVNSGITRKYILYAVGEIALVVIGILIALQVNNWNEDRIAKTRLSSHLEELKNEMEFNLRSWEIHMSRLNSADSTGLYVRSYLNNELEVIDTHILKSSVLSAGHLAIFNLKRVAYDNLVNSGDVDLLSTTI